MTSPPRELRKSDAVQYLPALRLTLIAVIHALRARLRFSRPYWDFLRGLIARHFMVAECPEGAI